MAGQRVPPPQGGHSAASTVRRPSFLRLIPEPEGPSSGAANVPERVCKPFCSLLGSNRNNK